MKLQKKQSAISFRPSSINFACVGQDGCVGISATLDAKTGIARRQWDSHGNAYAGLEHVLFKFGNGGVSAAHENNSIPKSLERNAFRSWCRGPVKYIALKPSDFTPVTGVTMGGKQVAGIYSPQLAAVKGGQKWDNRVCCVLANGVVTDGETFSRKPQPHLKLDGLAQFTPAKPQAVKTAPKAPKAAKDAPKASKKDTDKIIASVAKTLAKGMVKAKAKVTNGAGKLVAAN